MSCEFPLDQTLGGSALTHISVLLFPGGTLFTKSQNIFFQ